MRLDIRLAEEASLPVRMHDTDAGLDLCAVEQTTINRSEIKLVDTGVSVAIPPGMVGLLVPRSSLSKQKLFMSNSIGVIDSTYRGNIKASLLYKGTEKSITINKGERIVQLLVVPIALPFVNVIECSREEWESSTDRGVGGFGSTGKL